MDIALTQRIRGKTPKFNDVICNGLAMTQIPLAAKYVSDLFQCAQDIFPPGLVYEGYKICTPQEAYGELTRKGNITTQLDRAKNDLFMVRYRFSFDGKPIEDRFLYLPYVTDGGIITLRGARYSISPLLTDSSISVGVDHIYIPMGQAKLTFKRESQNFMRNGKPEMADVVWSQIYRRKQKSMRVSGYPAVRANTCLMHYLLCKYGLHGTFSLMRGIHVEVGDERNITTERFPESEWSIFASTGLKPRAIKDRHYTPTRLRIAVRNKDYDFVVASMIAGVFYIVEHFPQRMLPEYVDETRLWRILLGHQLFPPGSSEGKLVDDVNNHFDTVDDYLDVLAKDDLARDGVVCADIYGLFMRIIETFNQRITQSGDNLASMYDKRLVVLRFALYDIRKNIYLMSYQLKSKARKRLTPDDIKKIMRKFLKPNLVISMNTGHGEVSSISSPGDNKIHKITSLLVPQTSSSGSDSGAGKSRASMIDPTKFLHASYAEVGSYSNLPKSDPSGRSRINPFVEIDDYGAIVRKGRFAALIDNVQQKIKR